MIALAAKRALVRTAVIIAALGVGFGLGALLIGPTAIMQPDERPSPSQSASPDPVRVLLDQHDCWTGEAPADVEIPGGVVLTLPGKSEPQFSRRLVGPALEQEFGDGTTQYRIHGFCR